MEIFSNVALIWFLAGVVLLLLEFVIPGVFIMFFGIGAWITSLCIYLFEPSLGVQFLIFSATSVLSLIFLRKYLLKRVQTKEVDPDEEFVGHEAVCIVEIGESESGKVEFKGTNWTAISESRVPVNQKVKIISKEGLTLKVESV